jgi:hypothetical protein
MNADGDKRGKNEPMQSGEFQALICVHQRSSAVDYPFFSCFFRVPGVAL